jgi:hypothetical protein
MLRDVERQIGAHDAKTDQTDFCGCHVLVLARGTGACDYRAERTRGSNVLSPHCAGNPTKMAEDASVVRRQRVDWSRTRPARWLWHHDAKVSLTILWASPTTVSRWARSLKLSA